MHELRQEQQGRRIGAPADQQETQHRQGKAPEQNLPQRQPAHQARHGEEHADLRHDPERPIQADRRLVVAMIDQVDRVEHVERAVGHRHEEAGRQQGQHFGARDEAAEQGCRSASADFFFRQGHGAGQHARQDCHNHPKQGGNRQGVEHGADRQHADDETDRTPDTDAAIAIGMSRQLVERHRLDQWQGRAPEKPDQRHRHQHGGEIMRKEEAGEAEGGTQGREADDRHAMAQAVRQPAPQVGRQQAHHLRHRHQHPDLPGGLADFLQIEGEVRREGADESEIEEVPDGQTA